MATNLMRNWNPCKWTSQERNANDFEPCNYCWINHVVFRRFFFQSQNTWKQHAVSVSLYGSRGTAVRCTGWRAANWSPCNTALKVEIKSSRFFYRRSTQSRLQQGFRDLNYKTPPNLKLSWGGMDPPAEREETLISNTEDGVTTLTGHGWECNRCWIVGRYNVRKRQKQRLSHMTLLESSCLVRSLSRSRADGRREGKIVFLLDRPSSEMKYTLLCCCLWSLCAIDLWINNICTLMACIATRR